MRGHRAISPVHHHRVRRMVVVIRVTVMIILKLRGLGDYSSLIQSPTSIITQTEVDDEDSLLRSGMSVMMRRRIMGVMMMMMRMMMMRRRMQRHLHLSLIHI